MSKIEKVALAILDLTHAEMVEMAQEFVSMQTGAKEDNWEWKTEELHGEYGMISMLHDWAVSKV